MSYHDHNHIRHQRLSAAALVLLVLCTLGWGTQLAGVITLQQVCEGDLPLHLNDMEVLKTSLRNMALVASSPSITPLMSQQVMAGTIRALQMLAYQSTSSAFTLTHDAVCKEFYRYQWLNVAMQAFVLLLAFICLFTRYIHYARVALATLFAIATVLSIENAHAFFHVRHTAPTQTLHRGMVFFAGCVFTAAMNMLLILLLGTRGRKNQEVVQLQQVVTHNVVGGPVNPNLYQGESPMNRPIHDQPIQHVPFAHNKISGDGRPIYAA